HLDRNGPIEPRILRPVHFSHATRANRRLDLIRPQFCSCCQRHFSSKSAFENREGGSGPAHSQPAGGPADHLPCAATRRRTSSKKFVTSVTWLWVSRGSEPSAGATMIKRLPSGARSKLMAKPVFASCLANHTRGFSGWNEPSFTV